MRACRVSAACVPQQAGLELRSRSGEWLSVPPSSQQVVVIVGDMLERLSSGYFAATRHRVRATAAGAPRRHSLIYFHAMDEDQVPRPLHAARGGAFARWLAELPPAKRRRFAECTSTQREWTEAAERVALAALAGQDDQTSGGDT